MLLNENFVKILVEANQMSSKVAGHLFTYNVPRKRFEIQDKQVAKAGFKRRSTFLYMNAVALLLRILSIQFTVKAKTDKGNLKTDMNLCIMMLFICVLPAVRYRVRGDFPEYFVEFFNAVIQAETTLIKGNIFLKHQRCIQTPINMIYDAENL